MTGPNNNQAAIGLQTIEYEKIPMFFKRLLHIDSHLRPQMGMRVITLTKN
jgi:hypothetical protein